MEEVRCKGVTREEFPIAAVNTFFYYALHQGGGSLVKSGSTRTTHTPMTLANCRQVKRGMTTKKHADPCKNIATSTFSHLRTHSLWLLPVALRRADPPTVILLLPNDTFTPNHGLPRTAFHLLPPSKSV